MQKDLILIGLRNNEAKYVNTRHNAGSIVLNEIEKKEKNFKCYYSPTYMNLSGEVLLKVKKENNLKLSETYKNIFVFCDDVNLSLGEFKISFGEGASSQNGIKSIVEKLGSKNFYRVRVGIGQVLIDKNGKKIKYRPSPDEMSDYVLSNFSKEEIGVIKNLADNIVADIIKNSQI